MAAGDGAQEHARRHAARTEELRQRLELAEAAERSWSAGAEGERRVAAVLDSLAESARVVLHDVRWPGRPRANLDHVVVGPHSVLVVDAKNWTGEVAVHASTLWQDGRRRTHAVDDVVRAVAAVAAVLDPAHRTSVRGVLCLAGAGSDFAPVDIDGVLVTGTDHLAQAVRSATDGRLDPADVAAVADRLRTTGTPAPAPAADPHRALGRHRGVSGGGGSRAATVTRTRQRAAQVGARDLPGLVFVAIVGGAVLVGGFDGLQSLVQPVVDTLFAGASPEAGTQP